MWRLIFGFGVLLGTIGCGKDPLPELQRPDRLTLYSIDGRDPPLRGNTQPSETFHKYPVLGKVEFVGPQQSREMVANLKKAVERGTEPMASCFWPRHAIRAVENGKTIEFILCFECSQFAEFIDGTKSPNRPIDSTMQPAFDNPLQAAGVPLAPK